MKITKELAAKFDLCANKLKHRNPDPDAVVENCFLVAYSLANVSKEKNWPFVKFLVSEVFYSAMVKAKPSLMKMKGLWDILPQRSMYLINGILYAISHAGNTVILSKIVGMVPVAFYITGDDVTREDQEGMASIDEFDDLLGVLLFKQFADIEMIFVKPDETKILNGERYKNQSKTDITVLDSLWFRNIVRTEGFLVSGHFRLQPYGKSKLERKLIWIDEFQKNGYCRTSGKEMEG